MFLLRLSLKALRLALATLHVGGSKVTTPFYPRSTIRPMHRSSAVKSGSTAAARSTAAKSMRFARLARVMGFSYPAHSFCNAFTAPGVSGGRCAALPSKWRSSTASKHGRCQRITMALSAASLRARSARCGSRSAWSNRATRSALAARCVSFRVASVATPPFRLSKADRLFPALARQYVDVRAHRHRVASLAGNPRSSPRTRLRNRHRPDGAAG